MSSVKAIAAAFCAAVFLASPASAVLVKNTSSEAFKIGVDRGNDEEVKTSPEGICDVRLRRWMRCQWTMGLLLDGQRR